ncbi:MAG TPA: transglutaminase domain-containing protein [Candidatus Limnocylindrales bacterium]|nr:transglutaminase domain-containing protein [Candidatus Limnocylindrales bacterium]
MTAASVGVAGRAAAPLRRRIPLSPSEGWATVVFVALLVAAVGWAIDDSRWVLGRDEWTDFLPAAAAFGAVAGFLVAKSSWPRWVAHLAGAIAAAFVLPVIVGSIVVGDGGDPVTFFRATAETTVAAWYDLAILGRPRTTEFGHYLLALGIVCWSAGQFAAFAVFRHRRPLDAVVVVGLLLLTNLAITGKDQLGQLILFSLAGLFLLARSHAFDEQTAWIRRRIGDPAAVRALYLRGGTVFIVSAVAGSILLTSAASSAPLAGVWADAPGLIIELSRRIERFLPLGGASRPFGVTFGESTTISGSWTTNGDPALIVRLPEGETEDFYWRIVAYDTIGFTDWTMSDPRTVERAADALVSGLFDEPIAAGTRAVTVSVERLAYADSEMIGPATPVSASSGGVVTAIGDAAHFGSISLDGNPRTYEVTALVAVRDEADPNGLTQNRLRVAGRDYPAALAPYLALPTGIMGPSAQELFATVKARARDDNPYDLARAIESYLRSGSNFDYDTDVTDLACGDLSVVECFARFKQGYCQYYATTMAALLRADGIPARMVEGFLPGERDGNVETVRNSGAHAWVEAWFPGFGWVRFDPTGGNVAVDVPIPSGAPLSPRPSVSIPPASGIDDGGAIGRTRDPGDVVLPPNGPGGTGSPLAYAVIAVLLAVVVGGLAFIAWQRGPRGGTGPDDAWRGIGRLAGRFGFGPRPTQTVYEYAGALGEVLPASRPELQTVARAKVEVAYGRTVLSEARLRALRDAQRRLRVSLLRLAFRRRERPRR